MATIGILGTGSWGTALAVHWANAGHRVVQWARRAELAEQMARDRQNPDYLPGVELPLSLEPVADLAALRSADFVFVVVPSHGFREALRHFLASQPTDRPLLLISATKGIEVESLARMSRVTAEEGEAAGREVRFAVLSGPTFAAELARNLPSAAVIASEDGDLAASIRSTLATPTFRLYSSHDVIGVELGGTAKNVIAIAAGVVAGLGLGHNTSAALITRGLHELTRLGIACGGQAQTFAGLAGLGDLVLTCTGGLSRNRQTGLALAAGKTLAEITGATSMVAEGIRNSQAVSRLAAEQGIEMPITREMVAILYEGKNPRQAVLELMTRELKAEAKL